MPKLIMAIVDTVANDLALPLGLHNHEATAIRQFGDVAMADQSYIGAHIDDFQLVQLGILDDDISIIAEKKVVMTGAQWRAAQMARQERNEQQSMELR